MPKLFPIKIEISNENVAYSFYQRWARVWCETEGGLLWWRLNSFLLWGVKTFFPVIYFLKIILANVLILLTQFDIFMGVPPQKKPVKNFMMGCQFKVHHGGKTPHPALSLSLH